MSPSVSRLQVNQGFLVESSSCQWNTVADWKWDVFLHVVGNTFYIFLQLRHHLHKVLHIIALWAVEYNCYWFVMGLNCIFRLHTLCWCVNSFQLWITLILAISSLHFSEWFHSEVRRWFWSHSSWWLCCSVCWGNRSEALTLFILSQSQRSTCCVTILCWTTCTTPKCCCDSPLSVDPVFWYAIGNLWAVQAVFGVASGALLLPKTVSRACRHHTRNSWMAANLGQVSGQGWYWSVLG